MVSSPSGRIHNGYYRKAVMFIIAIAAAAASAFLFVIGTSPLLKDDEG